MEIVGSNHYLTQQIERLRRVVVWLAPFRTAFVVASIVAWVLLAWVLWQQTFAFASWAVGLVAVLSVLALGLPHWVDGLSAEIHTHSKQLAAKQSTIALLQSMLDENWALYQNIVLPDDETKLDIVLVGAGGFFLLELLHLDGTFQNSRSKWMRRAADQSWQLFKGSPTRKLLSKREQLDNWLKEQEIDCNINVRLVWTGDGLILQEEPEVPFWLLNQEQAIRDEIGRLGMVISAETRAKLNTKLKELISEEEQLPFASILS